MKQLIDFIPLIAFLVVYKMDPITLDVFDHPVELGGPFSATMVLILISVIVYGIMFIKNKSLEKSQLITLVAVLFLEV